MKDLIRFVAIDIISRISFMNGNEMLGGFEVASIVLIPCMRSGRIVITESPFPEIFLQ